MTLPARHGAQTQPRRLHQGDRTSPRRRPGPAGRRRRLPGPPPPLPHVHRSPPPATRKHVRFSALNSCTLFPLALRGAWPHGTVCIRPLHLGSKVTCTRTPGNLLRLILQSALCMPVLRT